MTPYLPTPSKLDSYRVKLGTFSQSDICCGMTLALMGRSDGATEPKKATYVEAGRNSKTRLYWLFPPRFNIDSGMSPGEPMVEAVPPKGTKQSDRGNEEKRTKGQEEVAPQVGQTSGGTPRVRVGQTVIGLSVFRKHSFEVEND